MTGISLGLIALAGFLIIYPYWALSKIVDSLGKIEKHNAAIFNEVMKNLAKD